MNEIYEINFDILTIVRFAKEFSWRGIRENSIARILYLASVLHAFRNDTTPNPFSPYTFSVDSEGPFFSLIPNSLIFLESNQYIKRESNKIYLGSEKPPKGVINTTIRDKWIKMIFYILAIYGEGKIYEFIIRDPEYQSKLAANTIKEIDISPTNQTVLFLKTFKNAFETELGSELKKVSDQKYLELYFDYLFSKVIKGSIQ